jgi:hypothetical protein
MKTATFLITLAAFLLMLAPQAATRQTEKSPDQELPVHITRLTLFGERADWSHDGKRVLFLSKTYGDAFEIDVQTRAVRLLTGNGSFLTDGHAIAEAIAGQRVAGYLAD